MIREKKRRGYVAVVEVAAEPSRQAALQRTGLLLHMMGLSGVWVDGAFAGFSCDDDPSLYR
jgi:hypothetical protein